MPLPTAPCAKSLRPLSSLDWAQELLLYGRDPYSPEVTREIQAGFYGRPLDPDRPGDRNYQQDSTTVYVAFYLAPTLHLPFAIVRKGFFWSCSGSPLHYSAVPRVLRWSVPLWDR